MTPSSLNILSRYIRTISPNFGEKNLTVILSKIEERVNSLVNEEKTIKLHFDDSPYSLLNREKGDVYIVFNKKQMYPPTISDEEGLECKIRFIFSVKLSLPMVERRRRPAENDREIYNNEKSIISELASVPHTLKTFCHYEYKSRKGIEKFGSITEYCHYSDLLSYVNNYPLDDYTKDLWSREMITGLLGIHLKNIIHRDIKPENVLIKYENKSVHTKIGDFGFCLPVKEYSKSGFKGTFRFFAPEILTPHRLFKTRKSDVWALGCTLYILHNRKFPPFLTFVMDQQNKVLNEAQFDIFMKDIAAYQAIPVAPNSMEALIRDMLVANHILRVSSEQAHNRLVNIPAPVNPDAKPVKRREVYYTITENPNRIPKKGVSVLL